jgi:Heparinase II/III N-terminus
MQAKTFLLFNAAVVASLGACWPSQAAAVGGDLPTAQSAAKAMPHLSVKTAADFVRLHPEKAEQLFKALDWSQPGLKDAARAHARGDLEATAVEVAAYFRRSSHGAWLREAEYRHGPGGYDDAIALADKVLADEYRFQSVSGPVARLGNGRIDWDDLGPRQDREWQFFLNRHFHLVPLLKAWQQTGDGRYAHRIEQDLQDWILYAGPPAEAESDKALPGRWQPMSSASRLLQVWPQTFYNLQTETSLSDGTRLLMLWSVPQQVNHLRRYHRRKHNHAIKEMIGLSHAGAAWPEFADAAEWRAYSQNVLEQELDFQIYPTGVQKELSAHYHLSVLNYFVDYVSFMRAAGFAAPPSFESRIEAMAGYVANAMRPDGGLPLNNNGDENNVRTRLMDLAAMFDRDDWRYLATNGSEGSLAGRQLSTFDPYAGQLIGGPSRCRICLFRYRPVGHLASA